MTARPSLLARFRARDHTTGSLVASIAVLSLPSVLMSVGGFGLFQLFDLWILGQLGPDAVAAAGATNQTLRQFVFLVILGVSVSSQMMIARLVGTNLLDRAEQVAGQTLLLGLVIAVLSALAGGLFAAPLIAVVAPDPDVVALGTIYVQITFLMLGATIWHQLFGSVLGGAGDTTTPMLITLVMTPLSIAAEWALAFGHLGLPAMGIAGVALGAGIGSVVGAIAMFWALFSGRCRVHLRPKHLVPDGAMLRKLISLSWQPALHMVARTTIVFFFMFLAGRLGSEVQAAYTIGLRLEMLFIMVAFPIGNACATLVGQNLGTGNLSRSWRAIWVGFGVELGLLWPGAAALFLLRHSLVGLFTDEPVVAALAAEYLAYSATILVFYGFYFISFRALQAAGDMNSPMIISISVALLLGAPLGFWLATRSDLGATGMWIGNLVYAVVNTLVTVGWLLTGRWARRAAAAGVPDGGDLTGTPG